MRFPELPQWEFALEEVSANTWRLVGRHDWGPTVERTGANIQELQTLIREDALKITAKLTNRNIGA